MLIQNFGWTSAGTSSGTPPIGGGGTLNYIAKFTPDGANIGNSSLYDNGTSVGYGTTSPSASAAIDLTSTTQGFLAPRMTTLQRNAIASPATGLWIYNTSSSFYNYWDGATWIQVDTSTGGDVSGSGTTNASVMWTDGPNSVIGNSTWIFTSNTSNLVVGIASGDAITSGDLNTIIGSGSLNLLNTGDGNTSVGQGNLTTLTGGTRNTAVGALALNVGTANRNTAVGYACLGSVITGTQNTAMGDATAIALVSGSYNTIIGQQSGVSITGDSNTVVGSGGADTMTGGRNTVMGAFTSGAAAITDSVGIGYGVVLPSSNIFVSSSIGGILDVYFGSGVTSASPLAYTIHGSGASGANTAGANITIAGGIGTGTGAGGGIFFNVATASTVSSSTANTLAVAYRITEDGSSKFTPHNVTSGAITPFTFTNSANTGQTATAEITSFLYSGGSRQWATGAITLQRETYFTTTTYTAVAASVISTAYGMFVEAPTASTNITITNNFAMGLLAGTATIKMGNLTGSTTLPAIYMNTATPSANNYVIQQSATQTIFNCSISGGQIAFGESANIFFTATRNAAIFSMVAISGSAITPYTYTVPANTNQTLSTEIPSEKYNGGSRQWATGAITTQRERYQTTTTYTAVGASTITDAYGMYVEAPTASTNVTITNNYGFGTNGKINIGNAASAGGALSLARFGLGTGIVDIGEYTAGRGAIWVNQATPTSTNFVISSDASNNTYFNGGSTARILIAGSICYTFLSSSMLFAPTSNPSSGSTSTFAFTNTASTNQTLSTEISGFKFTGGSRQWATGAITTQRETYFSTTTYTAVGASVITTAYGAYFEAPTASTNITITNLYGIGTNGFVDATGYGVGALPSTTRPFNASATVAGEYSIFITNLSSGVSAQAAIRLGNNSQQAVIGQAGTGATTGNGLYAYALNFRQYDYGFAFNQDGNGPASGALTRFRIWGVGATTNQTLSTEIPSFINTALSRQWATGAITTQREVYFQTATYTAVGASVITNAYGMYVEAPTASTNITITNKWAAGFNSSVAISGGLLLGYVAKTGTYTVTQQDFTIECTANTFTVTLLSAVGISGQVFVIKNTGSGTITIDTTSSQTIDGATTKTLTINGSYTVQSNGANWIII